MKPLFIKTTIFLLLTAVLFLFVLSFADGYADPFYKRFTSPQQKNLILGTSRAAQGLLPTEFKNELGIDIYNYSFTVTSSPYGPVYYSSISKKLMSDVSDGVFILTVDPWSISASKDDPNNPQIFSENDGVVGTTKWVNMNPNFPYLIDNNAGEYYKLIKPVRDSSMFLHEDGWLEVSVPMDTASVSRRTGNRIKSYRSDNLPMYKFSQTRLEYLQRTINLLKEHGNVYLVRLPVHPLMLDIEMELMPDFNDKIQHLIVQTSGYYDMMPLNNEFSYTDGNHLYKDSGKLVSRKICKWILEQNSKVKE